ncbi:MAG: hypothetical protein AB7K37_09830 [Cyclobacteriaceae bacterium]
MSDRLPAPGVKDDSHERSVTRTGMKDESHERSATRTGGEGRQSRAMDHKQWDERQWSKGTGDIKKNF